MDGCVIDDPSPTREVCSSGRIQKRALNRMEMGHRQWLFMMFSLVKLRLSSVVLGEVLRTSFLGYLKKKNLADTSA